MKVSMKQFEVWCGEYAERWNDRNKWDFYCLVKDAWINGFKKARGEIVNSLPALEYFKREINNIAEETIEVDVSSQQIGINKTFTVEQFKKDFINFYGCDNINVVVEKGLVSFQGTFKV